MGRPIKKGATDQSTTIFIMDSTSGLPETGVTFETAGIALWYRREKATVTAITEATLATTDAAHADGGIIHLSDGVYRLDLPDAAVAAGAGVDEVVIGGTVTGMIVIGNSHPLVNYDPYDGVRMGMTALPNAAADAAGGLPISDAGGLDLDTQIGTDIDAILVDTAVIGALGAGLTAIPWNAAWDAEVQSEVDDALVALNLDHLCAVATAAVDMTAEVVDGSIISRMISNSDTSLYVPATSNMTTVGADVAATHAHAGATDARVQADYGATEKAAIDLLDDAVGGLVDIHTDVGTAVADIAAVHVHAQTIIDDVAAVHAHVNDIHDTDLPAVTTDVAAVHVHVGTIDGHITADYGATEKAAVDLLDDAAGGLADIHTDLGTAIADVAAVHVHAATIEADVAAVHVHAATIEADTAELQTDWADGGRLDLILDAASAPTAAAVADAVWDELQADHVIVGSFGDLGTIADINATVDTALADIHLDHLLAVDYDPTAKPGVATALLNELVESDAGVSRFTANALEQSPAGTPVADIVDAVWDEVLHVDHEVANSASVLVQAAGVAADPWLTALPGAYAAGTAGHLIGDLGAPVGATLSADIAAIKAQTEDIHTDVGTAVTAIGDMHATDLPATKTVIDDIHTDIGTMQAMLTDVHATDLPAVKTVVDDIHTDVGTAVTAIGDVHSVDLPALVVTVNDIHATDLPAVKTVVDAILVDTGTTLDTAIAAVKVDTAAILVDTGTTLDARLTTVLADTNELQTDWVNGGRLDLLLDGAASAGDPWTTVLPGAYGAGTAGKIVGDNLNAPVGTVDTVVDAMKVVVDNIHDTDLPAAKTVIDDIHTTDLPAVKAETATILADTNELETDWHDGGRLDLLLDGATAPSAAVVAAAVWAEVLEGTLTAKAFQRIMLAVLAGASEGHDLAVPKFKSQDGLTTRAQGTLDASGNRTLTSVSGA